MNEEILTKLGVIDSKINLLNRLQVSGKATMRHGNIIIRNLSSSSGNKNWIFVCYHSSSNIYLCLKTSSEINEMKQIEEKWFGQKYSKEGKLVYQGDFIFFRRHTEYAQKKNYFQVIYDHNGKIQEVYQGKFSYDTRHDQEGILLTANQRLIGRWQSGNRQGEFRSTNNGLKSLLEKSPKKSFTMIRNFTNDVETKTPKNISQKLRPLTFEENIRYNVDVSQSLYKSLEPLCWLESGAVDFFFKHFNKSYNDNPKASLRLRCWTVYMFEKYITSSQIHSTKLPNYAIVQQMGSVFKGSHSSIFQEYPIMLMPLNQNQSHFVLAAIITKITRDTKGVRQRNKLEKVEFTLYHMDPLGGTSQNIFKHLKYYITKEIQQHIDYQKEIYKEAVKNIQKQNFSTMKFSTQSNFHDCGAFTCLFGVLLALDLGMGRVVNWKNLNGSIDKLRLFIQQDVVNENKSMLQSLVQMLYQDRVIIK